jgi:hypothetical protein
MHQLEFLVDGLAGLALAQVVLQVNGFGFGEFII